MGRAICKGLDWFQLDVDMFSDLRLRKLIKFQSGKAISVYTLLLCLIYKNGYYILWDKKGAPLIISELTGFSQAYVTEVFECCLKLGLFDSDMYKEHNVVTSRSIQLRYNRISSLMRRSDAVEEYSLIDKVPERSEFATLTLPEEEQQIRDDLQRSQLWLEQMRMRHNLTDEDLDKSLDDFFLDCLCRDKVHRNTADAKRHFNNWILKRKAINDATTNRIRTAAQAAYDEREQLARGVAATIARRFAQDDARAAKVR